MSVVLFYGKQKRKTEVVLVAHVFCFSLYDFDFLLKDYFFKPWLLTVTVLLVSYYPHG